MKRKRRAKLSEQDVRELVSLYVWGARMYDMELLYDVHRATIKKYMKDRNIPQRPNGRPVIVTTKRSYTPKSSRPQIPAGVELRSGDDPSVDQLVRSCARVQRDKRIEGRQ